MPFASTRRSERARGARRTFARAPTTLAFFAKAITFVLALFASGSLLLSEPPVAEVLREVAEGSVDGGVPGAREGLLGARAEHGLVRGERRLDRGGRRERVRERARGAPEGTLRRWADGACFVSGARGSGRESGATVTSRARRARARDERGSDAPERGAARKPRASFDRSAFSTLTLENDRVAIGTARASARTHPNVQERERACGET